MILKVFLSGANSVEGTPPFLGSHFALPDVVPRENVRKHVQRAWQNEALVETKLWRPVLQRLLEIDIGRPL